jgi:hypothetical protein
MLTFEPNVVVIDDKEKEVTGIIKHFRDHGIGCKYFNAAFDKDDYPESPFLDVSLIFLDIYYSDNDYDYDPELCSSWVQSIIPERSFYLLVIWTKDQHKAKDILHKLSDIQRIPYSCIIKSKEEYKENGEFKFAQLTEDIEAELKKTPALSEIGIWKRNIKSASNRVIGGLTKDHNPEIFKNKLQKIIISHGGSSIYSSLDSFQKRRILFDALDKVLSSNSGISDVINFDIEDENLYNLTEQQPLVFDRELNSWFHFKLSKESALDFIYPGLLCRFKEGFWKDTYSVSEDERLRKLLNKQYLRGVKIESIALLLNRPCDIAQHKFGNNLQLLSGLKIVTPDRKCNPKREFQFEGKIPDSCKFYDHLYFDEKENDVALLFDFRYAFSVPKQKFIDDFDKIKIFNKEVLSEIQVEYASYSSRLGITQII